jgi:hypothetical protein
LKEFNLDYRPPFYFGPQDLKDFYNSRILGQIRRNIVSETIDKSNVSASFRENSLDQNLRDALGQIHPSMMGGEYLPQYLRSEIELCRVILNSTTMDVTSLRVRKQKHRYAYRIVDEYSNKFIITKKTSTKPLSMREITQILDTSREILYDTGEEMEYVGLIKPVIEYMKQDGCKKEESIDFVTVESTFYPELFAYYEQQKEIWFEES